MRIVLASAAWLAACGNTNVEVFHNELPPNSSTSSTGSSTSSGAGGSTPSCKRGFAYGHDSVADLKALSKGATWWYTWGAGPDSSAVASAYKGIGIEFVPMVWGQGSLPALPNQVPAGAKYLLGFNEPNFTSQANLTPSQAASIWPQVESFAKSHNLALVSPAVNYCGSSCNVANPFDWLDQFFADCSGCQVDYIAMHWYACTQSALTGYLQQFEAKYKQPLWLTEFACVDADDTSEPAQEAYMQQALAVLEADPRVFRYAWFSGRSTTHPPVSLLGADGQLTKLGQIYLSYPGNCP
jgi:hypothetical protein